MRIRSTWPLLLIGVLEANAFSVNVRHRRCIELRAAESTDSDLTRRDALERLKITTAAGIAAASSLPQSVRAEESAVAESTPPAVTSGVPTVRLGGSSLEVSRTIQGYWQLAGGHGRYRESDAIANMAAHYDAGITTLDTADIYGPSELIVGKFMKTQPKAIPNTKFCCFRYLDEIDREEVKLRIQKVSLEKV